MSPSARGLTALLCAAALAGGCTKDEPAPLEDRTLAKLRQEVDRVNQGGMPTAAPNVPEDPNARLAGLAAGQEEDEARTYTLPSKQPVKVDTLSLRPARMESLHSLSGTGKVALTTTDLFVLVKLQVENTGPEPVDVTLSAARLVDAEGKEYPIARDAQTVGGTRILDHTWQQQQSESVALVFEVPPAAMAPGLALLIPTRGGQDARLPLR
ncbi:DUF4352 domain-containing protein [Vitiosangium sp. GDMCC 1.1324]|uniref:DUF4352 domain-containing protein n=1 Tax=Vitiosangium sp. (strain GDMCC 1.1324) TaxID=2138576 RepID=UPI000D36086D|nr:DUF4352 domain-containing protein [Vitiosangium sp. GDMCC 1.1324]PTL78567.1 hypothetical protein DAT35_39275 [Vitiosangium sp. GDMCC 1.1324]